MVRSADITEKIQKNLSEEDWEIIERAIADINQKEGRRPQKTLISEINILIIDAALKNNKPALLLALQDIPNNEIEKLFSRILRQFINTKDDAWLQSLFSLSDKLSKKSYQSRIFAMMAADLINAGVSQADPTFIDKGLIMLNQISFRKYRSDILIEIIPLIIQWTITSHNQKILNISFTLIEEISDISKRAVLHAELAKALTTIAILEKDHTMFLNSVRSATKIQQKIRRQECISFIIEKGAKSVFGKEISDIPFFVQYFEDIPREGQLDIISALTKQLLEQSKDITHCIPVLQNLCEKRPFVTGTVVIDLLNKSERSGEIRYLSTAMKLQHLISEPEKCPIREMVRAGISIARRSNNMQVLLVLIPIIDRYCNTVASSRIYLRFSRVMLFAGDFNSAVEIFCKISHEIENQSQYSDGLTYLLKEGILKDSVPLISNTILRRLHESVAHAAIYRTVIEVCKDLSFDDILVHIQSINSLILLYLRRDHLRLECISLLVNRGFLDSYDPGILIRLAESIKEQNLKERAISNIVIKIAKIGVQTNNRDFLQRAVGLTCEIDGQNTRSATLSSIIDEASILAAQQRDLDLLLRMREWCSSLLEKDLAAYAMANIIDGVIKYAIDRHSIEALEKAYLIAKDINDPSLKAQLFERIAECFVKIGCFILSESKSQTSVETLPSALYPFEQGLEILKQNIKTHQISLKIAGMIDILILYSRASSNPDYIIPLAMYSVEIENPFERDAMMSRIISNLNENTTHPDSTDPYEIMAFLLQRAKNSNSNPVIINLIFRTIQMISNPFVKLSGLCILADSSIKLHDFNRTRQILDVVCQSIPQLPSEYEKVLILSHLTVLFYHIDPKKAKIVLELGIQKLDNVEFAKNSITRRQMVHTIVTLNAIDPDPDWISVASHVASKITDPIEYINSLVAVFNLVHDNRDRCNEILKKMIDVSEKISSPYEKASILLVIIPLALQSCDDDTPLILLNKAEALTKKINIQFIADTIRDSIAQIFITLYHKNKDKKQLLHAIEITKSIDDDEVRLHRLMQMGHKETYKPSSQYEKIKTLSENIMEYGIQPNQIATLERLILSVADRGKEVLFFCDLAIFFKKRREEKISRRMFQNAIKEARIIRPLSRRAYVMCDIAMKMYAAGCERTAQEILDRAIDAATNIRQSSLRDEVFDELGLAIKILQGM